MNAIVLYRSKTGFTKSYAEWISQALGCPMKENKNIRPADLSAYDVIIVGGGLYAGGINGVSLVKKNFDQLKKKKLVVWATGFSSEREEDINRLWNQNFTETERVHIKTFFLRGGYDHKMCSFIDKMLMNMIKSMLTKKEDKTEHDKELLAAFDVPQDFRSKEKIEPLVSYVRSLA